MLTFKTINVEGEIRSWSFERVEDMLENWFSDDCTLPANDDPVVYAEYNGVALEADVFEDIINKFRR